MRFFEMIRLTSGFRKEIKSILLSHYNINCYKISDETNYSCDSGMFVLHLYCKVDNSKFPLFLNMSRPTDSLNIQELHTGIYCQGNSIMYVQGIRKKLYMQELNFVFEKLSNVFKTLGYSVNFSVMRHSSVSLFDGDCYLKGKKFDVSKIQPNLHSTHEIYVQSPSLLNQIKLSDFVIYGDMIELSNNNFSLQYSCSLFEKKSDDSFLVYLFKSYILLLKNKYRFLNDISLDDIEHASLDDLTDMIKVFEMERI